MSMDSSLEVAEIMSEQKDENIVQIPRSNLTSFVKECNNIWLVNQIEEDSLQKPQWQLLILCSACE